MVEGHGRSRSHQRVLLLGPKMRLSLANPIASVASDEPSSMSNRWSTSGKAKTRSIKALITSASLKQADTNRTCSPATNAQSALFETVGLPAQS